VLKMLGALLVLVSSCLVGNTVAKSYLARPEQLRELRHALQTLETEISYALTLLPEALEKAGHNSNGPIAALFYQIATFLSENNCYTAEEAWKKALQEKMNSLALLHSDREILLQLSYSFGSSDRENQLKHLKLAQTYLQKEEEKAEKVGEKNAPLWRYFGLIFGLSIIILLC